MRDDIPESFHAPVRRIQARLTARANRPRWEEVPVTPVPDSHYYASPVLYAWEETAAGLSVWSVMAGTDGIWLASFPLAADTSAIPRIFTNTYSYPAGVHYSLASLALALSGGQPQLYCAGRDKVYRLDGATWTQIAAFPLASSTAVKALDAGTLLFAYGLSGAHSGTKLGLIGSALETPAVETWEGLLPKDPRWLTPTGFRAADGAVYCYANNWNGTKPYWLRRSAPGLWSAAREVLPVDALDGESAFRVGHACTVGGKTFLTGTLKRRYGTSHSIYMQGPEKFTFGRDLILEPGGTESYTLAEVASGGATAVVFALSTHKVFVNRSACDIFGMESGAAECALFDFSLSRGTNQSDRLNCAVSPDEGQPLGAGLLPGGKVQLEVSSDGNQNVPVGEFGVDRVQIAESESGTEYLLDCSSAALKRLMDWQSDTYFDYLGQSTAYGYAGDLTRLVRASGGSYTAGETFPALALDSLNEDGMLYTTASASHGGYMGCYFTNVQPTTTVVGVGINYGSETLAEAAWRLNQPEEKVPGSALAKWGLFAVLVPDPNGGGAPVVQLVDWDTSRIRGDGVKTWREPFSVLQSVPVAGFAAPTAVRLGIAYQDGFARVYYSTGGSYEMTNVLSVSLPGLEHENYGRGAVYLGTHSGFHMTYPFGTESDVIGLYSDTDRYAEFGVPLEERVGHVLATGGTLQVDGEQIGYAGIAGWGDGSGGRTPDRRTDAELPWVPGYPLIQAGDGWSDPAGTDLPFASRTGSGAPHTHGDIYAMQYTGILGGDDTVITGVRVWLKKTGNPASGLSLTINVGNVDSAAGRTALLANVQATSYPVSPEQVRPGGGWVDFLFPQPVKTTSIANTGTFYYFILKLSTNPTAPDTANYYQLKKMPDSTYAGGSLYLYCAEDNIAALQSGDMAFVVYCQPEPFFPEPYFTVNNYLGSGSNLNGSQPYYKNCALVVTSGAGAGNLYRITRSRWEPDGRHHTFFLSREPGRVFDRTTRMLVVPAAYGLARGANSTTATAHGGRSKAHLPFAARAKAEVFTYGSADEDLTLAEVFEDVARKAGVERVTLRNLHPGSVTSGQAAVQIPARSQNCIVRLKLPNLAGATDTASVVFSFANGSPFLTVRFRMGTDPLGARRGFVDILNTTMVILSLPVGGTIQGAARVSLNGEFLSVWLDGRLAGTTHFSAGAGQAWATVGCALSQEQPTGVMEVLIPEAGMRVDNFAMDMGRSGAQLIGSLIGEKRVFFREDGTGGLVVYTDRQRVAGSYQRAARRSREITDVGFATRVLLEGGEVVEASDIGKLREHGNLFRSYNFSEINKYTDAAYFAGLVLEDLALGRDLVQVEGAVDLRIEPTDEVQVETAPGETRTVVVDQVNHICRVSESEAVYDMQLSGRCRPAQEEVE